MFDTLAGEIIPASFEFDTMCEYQTIFLALSERAFVLHIEHVGAKRV